MVSLLNAIETGILVMCPGILTTMMLKIWMIATKLMIKNLSS